MPGTFQRQPMKVKMKIEEPATMEVAAPQQTTSPPMSPHRHQSALPEDLQSEPIARQALDSPATHSDKVSLPWRPFYLRRTVLLSFAILFILIIAAIETLRAISNKNNGIATSTSTLAFLWTYGPTAFLTAVAAMWARAEYQSKLIAPWIRLSRNRRSKHTIPASHTLLLDYVSQFSIFAIISSLRNGDFTVSITIAVSFLLKLLIVLSGGLISLQPTNITQDSYPMVLESKFVDSNVKLPKSGDLASYILAGLRSDTFTLPEGISSEYAFQSVRTDVSTDLSETRITVDGLKSSLQCDSVGLSPTAPDPDSIGPVLSTAFLSANISSTGCNVSYVNLEVAPTLGSSLFARSMIVGCDRSEGYEQQRLLIFFGNITRTYNTANSINIVASTQLLCVPSYSIDRVEVVHHGAKTKTIMPVKGAFSRKLHSIRASHIMEAQLFAGTLRGGGYYGDPLSSEFGGSLNISTVTVNADLYMAVVLGSSFPPSSQVVTLFDPAILQKAVEASYQQISAIVSKQALMEPAQESVLGLATFTENRLIVHPSVAQSMVGVLVACLLFSLAAVLIVPSDGFLPYSPSTLLCLVPLLLYSCDLLVLLRGSGASDDHHLAQGLEPFEFGSEISYDVVSNQARFRVNIKTENGDLKQKGNPFPQISSKIYHPIALHPTSRATICLVVVSLIATLELLLTRSTRENGLGDVNDNNDAYTRYAWTVVPALVFGLLSIIYSTVDSQIRALAPYMALSEYVSKDVFSRLELLDMTLPVAMYNEFKLRNPYALATTTALLFASLFTTLSASLFQEKQIPSSETYISLQANQSFHLVDSTRLAPLDAITPAISLILKSNLSFPRFTFNDLAFPQIVPIPTFPGYSHYFNESIVSISTVIPALRGRLDCHLHEAHVQNFTIRDSFRDPFDVIVDGNTCRFFINVNTTYIGRTYQPLRVDRSSRDLLYVWGRVDLSASAARQHIVAVGCNATVETVDVNATFIGTDLDFDFRNPPRPLNGTARRTSLDDAYQYALLSLGGLGYHKIAEIDMTPQDLDPFFAALVTSPWAIPISSLGEPSANTKVIDAIKFQHGIIQAQTLAQWLGPANETNSTLAEPIGPGDNDAQPRYNASAIDPMGRQRIVQDAVSTHVLVALLATTLVLSLVGWAGTPGTKVLPRSPTTIASTAVLLAGGNIFSKLPANAHSPEEILAALGGPKARFWMGWGNLPDEEGRRYGGENEAGVSQFGIFVVDEEETQST
ncbi:hypothetical protein NUW58_g3715 [Xylaria curta]|uniref:Uncharacterized protein n=1 Tax=Xylaria curta TaxID=42375 RepID=A0ACC1P9P0_9PEZI|nr:hypothetical protein NUW58_g3715 [Xylaria curta]